MNADTNTKRLVHVSTSLLHIMAFLCTFKLRLYLHYFYQKLNAVVCFLGRKCCCKQCSSKLLLSI